MKSVMRGILAGMWCLGTVTAVSLVGGCVDHDHYDHQDYVDVHGWHHQGYYDENHGWHGGYYDDSHQFHQDPPDWHQ
jgi:hypothetical protein